MTATFPDYLCVPADQLGRGTPVKVHLCGGADDIARRMAEAMLAVVAASRRENRPATLIVPVGPVDQFPLLAEKINQQGDDWRDVMLVNMDEYLTDDDRWVDVDHPLSFRGYMNRKFYDLVDPKLAPRPENRVFPDPADGLAIGRLIAERGGVDACFGGVGINGHIAFNEPPEPGQQLAVEQFAALPTRCST